jgi:hypothetical protein
LLRQKDTARAGVYGSSPTFGLSFVLALVALQTAPNAQRKCPFQPDLRPEQ